MHRLALLKAEMNEENCYSFSHTDLHVYKCDVIIDRDTHQKIFSLSFFSSHDYIVSD